MVELVIDGAWPPGSAKEVSLINPERKIGGLASADERDLEDALDSAQWSLAGWASPLTRKRGELLIDTARLLESRLKEAAPALSEEQGETVDEARCEYLRAVETLEWNDPEANTLGRTVGIPDS